MVTLASVAFKLTYLIDNLLQLACCPRSSRTEVNIIFFLMCTVDRDQTVSRRFKPSSRTILFGEQPNPWQRMLHQDMMSRHRGAKQSLR